MKKEGKLLTKAQKEAKDRNEMRMKQMLEAGAGKVAGLESQAEKKKPVYEATKKKKGPKKEEDDLEAAAARAQAQRQAEEERRKKEQEEKAKAEAEAAAAAPKEESDELDDWEKAADAEDVKDSWDLPLTRRSGRSQSPTEELRLLRRNPLLRRRLLLRRPRLLRRRRRRRKKKNPLRKNQKKKSRLRDKKPMPREKQKPRSEERNSTRKPWPLDRRRTCARPSVVFLATSILVKRSCWTRSDRHTCKKARLAVSRNRLARPTSLWMRFVKRLLW